MLTESKLRQLIRNIIAEGENEAKPAKKPTAQKKLLSKFEACIKNCCNSGHTLSQCRNECSKMYDELSKQEKEFLSSEIAAKHGKGMTYSDFVVNFYKKCNK